MFYDEYSFYIVKRVFATNSYLNCTVVKNKISLITKIYILYAPYYNTYVFNPFTVGDLVYLF